jgi:catechol 2,3-dioxygenase-like lactoylglutathione lyase family enzyme
VGVMNETEEQAVRFYVDFLEFEKTKESVIPPDLSQQLFSVSRDIKLLLFERNNIKIEVFICPDCKLPSPDFTHIGLLLENFSAVLEKATQTGVEIIIGKTKEKTVYFIKDFSGNLIEIKAA